MFQNTTQKELQWLDNGQLKGLVKISNRFDFKKKTTRPFIRNKVREVLSIGRVNYEFLNQFIINALNDYYSHITEVKDEKLRTQRVNIYNELYGLWYKVNIAKQQNDLALNSYYDDLVYRLYTLGYR